MKKITLVLSFCAFANFFFSQNFAYSFNGILSESQQNELIAKILTLPEVSSCKLKYKSDSQKGEFLISVTESTERTENISGFSPVFVKELFVSQNIEPLEFRQLK